MDGSRQLDAKVKYVRPRSLVDAVPLLASGDWVLLAGGTDYFPGLREGSPEGKILDLTGIEEMRGVKEDQDHWRIGALTTWTDIIATDFPCAFDALKQAAREVGSAQIQNRATIAGNLCNASPAADGVPPLMVLDAEVSLMSSAGERRLGLGAFIQGNRTTALMPGEIVTEILIPKMSSVGASNFMKLGAREYLVISIAMAASRLSVDRHGNIEAAAICVGACSAVARRLSQLEEKLIGRPATPEILETLTGEDVSTLTPIDDIRAPAEYRVEGALELVRRTLLGCLAREDKR
jgi:CO/xanthine dehydrogenase FAD-binding subunit